MLAKIKTFFKEQNGAVTVDWVILTAAVAVIAVGDIVAVTTQTKSYSETIAKNIPSDI